jgi:formylglycine-generating enzyme required for sulfatase activity
MTEANVAIGLEHQRLMRFIPLDVAPSRPPPLWTAYQNVPFRDDYPRGLEHLLARLNGRPPRPGANGSAKENGRNGATAARLFADRQLHERSRVELIRIPAGSFLFGPRAAGSNHAAGQRSLHLPEFWIGYGPVTNAQFARFVEATRYRTTAEETGYARVWLNGRWTEVERALWRRPEGPRSSIDERLHHPVVCVSWFDAGAYCEWAGLRLPAEKEWEKAARGADGRLYPWGDAPPAPHRANYAARHGSTTAAGQFSLAGDSPYGVSDLAGNVWEWTASWGDGSLDEPVAGSGRARVVRGGAWPSEADNLLATYRVEVDPSLRFNTLGFRVVAHLGDPGF